jgi:DNA topoisomerase IB
MSVPIYTLLKTYMRVGNDTYYRHNGHKGLTTLSKENIKIKNNFVTFNFLAKDGVPMNITHEFPIQYIKRLKQDIKNHKPFVFQSCSGDMLKDTHFKRAFKRYVGEEFYPHIVRSFFATHETKEFLRENKNPKKQEVRKFLKHVAHELGHRKFNKKKNEWEESYAVTISHYIAPKLAEKLRKFSK